MSLPREFEMPLKSIQKLMRGKVKALLYTCQKSKINVSDAKQVEYVWIVANILFKSVVLSSNYYISGLVGVCDYRYRF